MTLTITDLLADIEPVVRGWIEEQIGDNANSNIPGDQFEFEFDGLTDGDTLYYDGTAFEWKNTSTLSTFPGSTIVKVNGDFELTPNQGLFTSCADLATETVFTNTAANYQAVMQFSPSGSPAARNKAGISIWHTDTSAAGGYDDGEFLEIMAGSPSYATDDFVIGTGKFGSGTDRGLIIGVSNDIPALAFDVNGLATFQGSITIDITNTEALLVRKNGDGGDVLTVDTTNEKLIVNSPSSNAGTLLLSTSNADVLDNAVLGQIDFQAPLESSGTDAILVVASIWAEAETTFSASANNTALVFATATSEVAAEKMRLNAAGYLGIGTNAPAHAVHVSGVDNYAQIRLQNTTASTGKSYYIRSLNTGTFDFLHHTGNIVFSMDTTGYVGIGFGSSPSSGQGVYLFTNATVGGTIGVKIQNNGTGRLLDVNSAAGTKVTVLNNGRVGFSATPLGQVHIDQTSATGAIPTLFLDQGDVSEQIIKASYSGADVDMIIIELDVDGAPKYGWSETPNVFTLNKGLAVGDGGTTNYANFAGDGELTLFGTARTNQSVDVEPLLTKRPAANPPGEGTEDGFLTHDFNAGTDESVFFHWEIPHDYASAGTIHIHFDFFVDTAPAGAESVVWGVEYKKQSVGDNFDFSAGTTTGYTQESVTTGTPANDKKIHRSGAINLTVTGFEPGDFVLLRFFRDANGTGGTDDYTADARIVDYHIEYIGDKLGEAT